MRLQDKVAIVTGGGLGFGEGIAKLYAAEGAKVLVADIDGARAERVAGEIGGAARAATADVAKGADFAAHGRRDASRRFGRLDIVVNNAGITHRNQPLLEVDEATYDRVFAVNVKSIYWSAQHARAGVPPPGRRLLRQHRVDRRAAAAPGPHLVQRLQGRGDHDQQVDGGRAGAGQHPGQRDLPGDRRDRAHRRVHGRRQPGAARPVRRHDPARPHEPAERRRRGGVFLASDEAEFFTGVALEVDGGRCV